MKQLACLKKYRMQQTKPCEDWYLSLMRQEAKLHVLGMMVVMRAIKKKQTQAA
ncbi:uncharacterized protein LAESUDRAFT_728350 [Laetiporus sulphureus 93-53]|uniref:Uncharacterized protein n=1 Tax=Laetiporus sulphureus 93-53 TaxID=1314785 RepID=A0A165D4N4_9APHY|nr:uncharacterized protein LAESUDRAFT_728350 [Laetiporus sulphureus 93-53]KZT04144.1 hypothetical protein LAESUDRAFT_728350 [Laetiporus sulphureus 93-53]